MTCKGEKGAPDIRDIIMDLSNMFKVHLNMAHTRVLEKGKNLKQ